jgi:hypothetical protein
MVAHPNYKSNQHHSILIKYYSTGKQILARSSSLWAMAHRAFATMGEDPLTLAAMREGPLNFRR